jgi:hypothetical protein
MKYLSLIRDLNIATQIDESLSWAIRYLVRNRITSELVLFKLPGWSAVPATIELLVDPSQREHIVSVLQKYGYQELYAIHLSTTSFLGYLVPVTTEGLDEFCRELGAFSSVLFVGNEEPNLVWISIESEVYIISGPSDFVDQLLPWGVEGGFSHFRDFMMHEPMDQGLRQFLEFIGSQLSGYQHANEGDEFHLIRS